MRVVKHESINWAEQRSFEVQVLKVKCGQRLCWTLMKRCVLSREYSCDFVVPLNDLMPRMNTGVYYSGKLLHATFST